MPAIVGPQFQGEWALYSCSMLSAALVNTTLIYDEDREANIARIDSLIQMVMSPELRAYDRERWGEEPLETLDGKESHVSYLSHLAWMIGGYKRIGGGGKYDELYHRLCETMNRRIHLHGIIPWDIFPQSIASEPWRTVFDNFRFLC